MYALNNFSGFIFIMNVSIKLGVGETEEQLKPLAEKKLKQKQKRKD